MQDEGSRFVLRILGEGAQVCSRESGASITPKDLKDSRGMSFKVNWGGWVEFFLNVRFCIPYRIQCKMVTTHPVTGTSNVTLHMAEVCTEFNRLVYDIIIACH